MSYIIILKVRKFHQSTRNRFGTAGKEPIVGTMCPPPPRVNSEAPISTSSQKIRYEYVLKEKNVVFLRKTEDFAQALLDKSVAMATPLVTVY